ncbi:MAG: hypothetical protein GDA48_05970 [Hormoscilla sp. GM102CHS1]|nr:hypothetical protein [Hormoscilla sp. GM102CHS1]
MNYHARENLIQAIAAAGMVLLCAGAIALLQIPQLKQLKADQNIATPEKVQREVAAEKARIKILQQMPGFGFDNLIANWTMVQFLIYFGDEPARAQTGYSLSPEYFEAILDRDPRFLDAYFFLSSSVSLYAGIPERSVAMLDKVLKLLDPQVPPKSYYIWRYKAIDELLFLGDGKAAKKSFEMAADWASNYSDPESQAVATVSSQTAAYLATNPDSKSAQISAWTMVLNNAIDDRTRQIAIDRIRALGGRIETTPSGALQIIPPPED